jgi:hypothetical protein
MGNTYVLIFIPVELSPIYQIKFFTKKISMQAPFMKKIPFCLVWTVHNKTARGSSKGACPYKIVHPDFFA